VKFLKVKVDGVEVLTATPAPGTKWKPLHRKPHISNKPISIRRYISQAEEQKKS
jgi:hypothetical protein